jgi:hypothetical protein
MPQRIFIYPLRDISIGIEEPGKDIEKWHNKIRYMKLLSSYNQALLE